MPSTERPREIPRSSGDLKYWAYRVFNQRDGINVEVQDQYSEIVDLLVYQVLDTMVLLANYSIDDQIIDIETTGYVPVVGNHACLKENTAFLQTEILAVSPLGGNQYRLTLDQPLDFAYTTAGGCSIQNTNIATAVGSLGSPVTFYLSPEGLSDSVSWDITRATFTLLGPGPVSDPAPDDTRFGTIDALANGVVVRATNGITKNLFNAKTNGDLRMRCGGDLLFIDANKNGEYAVSGRRTFSGPEKNGVTIRMHAETRDRVEIIIQDDLTDMSVIRVNFQGHAVWND